MASKVFRALIIGPPAAGKGTISGRIVRKFDCAHIASGDILRQNVADQTPLGKRAKEFMECGKLVPDQLVEECILGRIGAIGNRSWLLDGYPRTTTQAKNFCELQRPSFAIYLNVPFEVIIERAKDRWIHAASGRIYNLTFNQPKVPFKDDITGDALTQRPDDKPEAMRARLEDYSRQTTAVLAYFKSMGILAEFKGRTSDEIWPQVEQFIAKGGV